jgi:hypothetical protein
MSDRCLYDFLYSMAIALAIGNLRARTADRFDEPNVFLVWITYVDRVFVVHAQYRHSLTILLVGMILESQ